MSLAKVHTVQKAQKDPGACGKCHKVLFKGDSYLWYIVGFRSSSRRVRCVDHPPRMSERESSMVSEAYAAVENLEDELDGTGEGRIMDIDQLQAVWDEFAQSIRDYAEMRRNALDGWENGNSQLEEYAETAETAADEAEDFQVEEFDEYEVDDDDPDGQVALDEERATHLEEQIEAARDAAQNLCF